MQHRRAAPRSRRAGRPPAVEVRAVSRTHVTVALALALLAPSSAFAQDDQCLSADPPPPTAPPRALRFGITPQLAGSAGVVQLGGAPVVDDRALAALRALRP